MATDTATDDTPVLIDRERWDGDVVGQTRFVYRWGAHAYPCEMQLFADGDGYITINAPRTPPPSAENIVRGGLEADPPLPSTAAILAKEWGIDVEEVSP